MSGRQLLYFFKDNAAAIIFLVICGIVGIFGGLCLLKALEIL